MITSTEHAVSQLYKWHYFKYRASQVALVVKNLPAKQETQVQSLGQEDLLEKGMTTHSSILPGEFHGQRSVAGYSSWGCKETQLK